MAPLYDNTGGMKKNFFLLYRETLRCCNELRVRIWTMISINISDGENYCIKVSLNFQRHLPNSECRCFLHYLFNPNFRP